VRLHHLALTTPNPDSIAGFYASLLALREQRRQEDESGVRSVWFDLDGVILMIERGDAGGGGWDGVYLRADPGTGAAWEARFAAAGAGPVGRTGSTLYGRDPDGNRFGVSSWPEPLFG
jgi:catechol 2,3-dioxygenase-like lactoylglutathione lyase family enzyme